MLIVPKPLTIGVNQQVSKSMVSAAESEGHELIPLKDCIAGPAGHHLVYRQQPITLDAVLQREPPPRQFTLQTALDYQGALMLNPALAIKVAKNKFLTYMALKKHQVPTPASALLARKKDIKTALGYIRAFCDDKNPEVVIKPLMGSRGRGVQKLPFDQAASLLKQRHLVQEPLLLQPFIPPEPGQPSHDYRFIMLNDLSPDSGHIASMRRVAAKGEFRANLSRGGTGERLTTDMPVHRQLAHQALKALGLGYGGIDLMDTPAGPVVIEANASPGNGISDVVGYPVPRRLMQRMAERIRQSR